MNRREFIVGAGAAFASPFAIGKPVRSSLGADYVSKAAEGWTNPYVTDGLVAMWDGEWNAGGGMHDGTLTDWYDLTGNNHKLYAPIPSWGDNYSFCENNAESRFRATADEAVWFKDLVATGKYSIELVFKPAVGGGGNALNYYVIGFGLLFSSYAVNTSTSALYLDLATNGSVVNTRKSIEISGIDYLAPRCGQLSCDMSAGIMAMNGQTQNITGTFNVTMEKQGMALGARGNLGDYSGSREMRHYRFAVYNRPLSSSELEANYGIDRERFGL